jgi:hypothetical protein
MLGRINTPTSWRADWNGQELYREEGITFDNYYWMFYDQSDNDVKLDYTAQNVQDEATGAGHL